MSAFLYSAAANLPNTGAELPSPYPLKIFCPKFCLRYRCSHRLAPSLREARFNVTLACQCLRLN